MAISTTETTMSDTPTSPITDAEAAPPAAPAADTPPPINAPASAATEPSPPPADPAPAEAPPPGGVVSGPTVAQDLPAAGPSIVQRAVTLKASVQAAQAEGDIAPLIAGYQVMTAELVRDLGERLDRLDYLASPDTLGEQIASLLSRVAALEAPRQAAADAGLPTPDGKTLASAQVAAALELVANLRAGGQIGADQAATFEAIIAAIVSLDGRAPT
jgi:hypothetical protein